MAAPTRDEMISALLEDFEDLDEETLIDRALASYYRELRGMTPAALKAEYRYYLGL